MFNLNFHTKLSLLELELERTTSSLLVFAVFRYPLRLRV
jgi:hypothetical protein